MQNVYALKNLFKIKILGPLTNKVKGHTVNSRIHNCLQIPQTHAMRSLSDTTSFGMPCPLKNDFILLITVLALMSLSSATSG